MVLKNRSRSITQVLLGNIAEEVQDPLPQACLKRLFNQCSHLLMVTSGAHQNLCDLLYIQPFLSSISQSFLLIIESCNIRVTERILIFHPACILSTLGIRNIRELGILHRWYNLHLKMTDSITLRMIKLEDNIRILTKSNLYKAEIALI